MKYKIEYSQIAIRDLDRAWIDVLEVSKSYTVTENYISSLLDKIDAKAEFPKSGSPLYYDNSFTGYYFVVYKSYIAFYRLKDDRILVDRVLFGKSDYLRQLNIHIEETDNNKE